MALRELGNVIRDLDLNKIASFVIGGTLLLFVGQITQLSGSLTKLADNASGFLNKFSKKLFGSNTKIKGYGIYYGGSFNPPVYLSYHEYHGKTLQRD